MSEKVKRKDDPGYQEWLRNKYTRELLQDMDTSLTGHTRACLSPRSSSEELAFSRAVVSVTEGIKNTITTGDYDAL